MWSDCQISSDVKTLTVLKSETVDGWYDNRVKCQEIHCVCGNLNLWGGCRVLYPVLVTVQQCCGQDRPACCVRGHSLSTQYRAELFCGCPGTQHQPAATCQDQTVRTVDTISRDCCKLWVLVPLSLGSAGPGDARVSESGEQWRPAAAWHVCLVKIETWSCRDDENPAVIINCHYFSDF